MRVNFKGNGKDKISIDNLITVVYMISYSESFIIVFGGFAVLALMAIAWEWAVGDLDE